MKDHAREALTLTLTLTLLYYPSGSSERGSGTIILVEEALLYHLNQMGISAWYTDRRGVVEDINEAALNLLGAPYKEKVVFLGLD